MERQHNYGKVIDLVNFLEKTSIDDPSQKTVLESMVLHPEDFKTKDTQTHDRGVWSQEFSDMGLPSFLELYLFLTKIAFDILHESMRYHLDHRPKGDPSSMSIKQVQQLNFSSLFLLIISQQAHILDSFRGPCAEFLCRDLDFAPKIKSFYKCKNSSA